ncbi:hypothetical protein P2H44_18155 [Albimonas sp. CAU 1670]|uniref:hypothetical protein n=1 Tax=Albimonas sp. CAU 1670 TaxID=3032599 RepID=UPI0023DAF026|nr:hypothetical protein [Albimonas sp. CAU 1670]MDF2234487.1 hypothetical protein [Albimonas sp. CAU 1670]
MSSHLFASRAGAALVGLVALGACGAGTPGGDGGPPPRPPMAVAECRQLIAAASPETLAARGVALLIAEPRLVEGGASRPVALRLHEQATGETATLDCVDGDVVWGAIPPGRWRVDALAPAGGAGGAEIPLAGTAVGEDELRLGAGETVHLSHPVWTRQGGTLAFRSELDERAERATVRRLAPNVGTALLLRELGEGG